MKMDKVRSIKEAWDVYAKGMPANAGEVQRRETRIAFYAGAVALYSITMAQLEPGLEPTQTDLDFMETIHSEIKDFLSEIRPKTVN